MRKRVDGLKFEHEFRAKFNNVNAVYLLRLPTPTGGRSGVMQPADFLLSSRKGTRFVELKETGGDTFSVAEMQQLSEIEKFETFLDCVRPSQPLKYDLVVHFIKHGIIKVLTGNEVLALKKNRKTLKYNDDVMTYNTLDQYKEAVI